MPIFHGRKNKLLVLPLCFLANTGFAGTWDFSAAGGVGWYNRHNNHFIISPFETDQNKVQKSSVLESWQIGVGYITKNHIPHMNNLTINLNIYHTSTLLEGDVWQYQQPQFNNYHFKAPIKSTRLMLELSPHFYLGQSFMPYGIFGMGISWNAVSYKESVINNFVSQTSRLILSHHTSSHFAFDVGIGNEIRFTDNLGASIEYVYAFLGYGYPSHHSSNIEIASTPKFLLQNHSVLLGINIGLS